MNDPVLDERVLAVLPGLYQKARRGLIKKPVEDIYGLIETLTGEPGGRYRYQELEDAGYLCRTEAGVEMLPLAQEIFSAISAIVPPAEPEQHIVPRSGARSCDPERSSAQTGNQTTGSHIPANWLPISIPQSSPRRGWTRTPWRRPEWQRLAREVFPTMCKSCGIRNLPGETTHLFAYDLYKWWEKERVEISMIEAMIWEFGKHPEWARRSRRPAWKVFLSRRDDLIALIGKAQAKVGVSGERNNPAAWLNWYTPRTATTT